MTRVALSHHLVALGERLGELRTNREIMVLLNSLLVVRVDCGRALHEEIRSPDLLSFFTGLTGRLCGHSDPIRNALKRKGYLSVAVPVLVSLLLKEGRVQLVPVASGKKLVLLHILLW